MRIDVTKLNASRTSMTELTMSHKGQKLSWNVSAYDRVAFKDGYLDSIFTCINDFWATLPAEQLAGIWETYGKIHAALQSGMDARQLGVALRSAVARLYSFMPYESIQYWVNFKANVKIPGNIPIEYAPNKPMTAVLQIKRDQQRRQQRQAAEEGAVVLPGEIEDGLPRARSLPDPNLASDLNYPRELTYLRKDYQELAVLSVALRPMVPIWGEYINRISDEAGGAFKESWAMQLLYDTPLPNTEAMARLMVYMDHSVVMQKQKATSHAAIAEGLGTADLPNWLMAGCCVRRLVFGRLHVQEDSKSIIASVYRYVSSTMKSMDSSFGGKINAKTLPSENGDDDTSSYADIIKIKQDIREADLVAMNIYSERLEDITKRVDPTISMKRVLECLAFMSTIASQPIHPHQQHLVSWVMAGQEKNGPMSPRCVPYLKKASIIRCLAVTQAALWHWEFYDLAALVTAIQLKGNQATMMFGNETRSRVPKELVEAMQVTWPHHVRRKGKDKSVRHYNAAYIAIDEFCDIVTAHPWQANAPAPILEKVESVGAAKLLMVDRDLRSSLANLFNKLA